MKPSLRLKEIEERDVIGLDNLFWDDQRWLIGRVKKLTEALVDIRNNVGFGGRDNLLVALDKIKKALEEE